MRYCPKCQGLAEALGSSETCAACGTVLQSMDTLSDEELDRPVVLTYCSTIEEATVLKLALGEQGIDSFLEDEGLLEAINPFHGNLNVGPRVMVRLRDAEAAMEFLRRKADGELAITEDDVPAEDQAPPGDSEPSNN